MSAVDVAHTSDWGFEPLGLCMVWLAVVALSVSADRGGRRLWPWQRSTLGISGVVPGREGRASGQV